MMKQRRGVLPLQSSIRRLSANDETLTTLNLILEFNLVVEDKRLTECQSLASALCVNTTLTSLNLGGNQIGVRGCRALAKALPVNTTLSNLNLNWNDIGTEGCKTLAEGLRLNTSLKTLDLERNQIGPDGGKALGVALRVNSQTSLTKLKLYNNKLGPNGCYALSQSLRFNQSLTELDLSYNDIGPNGCAALAKALAKDNQTLAKLMLYGNQIGDDGCVALARMLQYNRTITIIDIQQNDIGVKGTRALVEVLRDSASSGSAQPWADNARNMEDIVHRTNKTLTMLKLSLNPNMPSDMISDILFYVRLNTFGLGVNPNATREQWINALICAVIEKLYFYNTTTEQFYNIADDDENENEEENEQNGHNHNIDSNNKIDNNSTDEVNQRGYLSKKSTSSSASSCSPLDHVFHLFTMNPSMLVSSYFQEEG